MNRTVSKKLIIAGLLIIAATNAIVLAGAAYNRSGDATYILEMTEREAQLPFSYRMAK